MNPDRLRCPRCRTRRTDAHAMVVHRLICPKNVWCHCGGPAFVDGLSKHRPGTLYCDRHPEGPLHVALRYAVSKEDEEEILRRWTEELAARRKLADNPPF